MTHEELRALYERLLTAKEPLTLTVEEATELYVRSFDMARVIQWTVRDLMQHETPITEFDYDAYYAACAVDDKPLDETVLAAVDDEEDGDE